MDRVNRERNIKGRSVDTLDVLVLFFCLNGWKNKIKNVPKRARASKRMVNMSSKVGPRMPIEYTTATPTASAKYHDIKSDI
jgi:hypothetical protein